MAEASSMLAVDIGTSAVKAVLFGPDLGVRRVIRRSYPVLSPGPERSEQDPERVTSAVVAALAEAVEAARGAVRAVAFSAQMYSILAVDAGGRALTPSLTWADRRSAEQADDLRRDRVARRLPKVTGCPLDAIYPLAKIRWLRAHGPRRVARFVSIKEYVLHRLTGQWVVDASTASASGLLNLHRQAWDRDALACAGVRAEELSTVVSPRHRLPEWSAWARRRTGLRADVPGIIGGGDGPLASIGLGASGPGVAAVNVGTSAAARVLTANPPADPDGRLWTYVADDGLYATGGIVSSGGLVLDWARRTLGLGADAAAVLALAGQAPPGAAGVHFVPYLAGEQCPAWNPAARGAFRGLALSHGPAHLARAVVEGIAGSIGRVVARLADVTGRPVRRVLIGGELGCAPLFAQIAADTFGCPVCVPDSAEASARGAAIVAQAALGLRACTVGRELAPPVARTHRPRAAVTRLYRARDAESMS